MDGADADERSWLTGNDVRSLLRLAAPRIGPRKLGWFCIACAETLLRGRPAAERSTTFLPAVRAAVDGGVRRDEILPAARDRERAELEHYYRLPAVASDAHAARHHGQDQFADQEATALAAVFLANALSDGEDQWWNRPSLAHVVRFDARLVELATAHLPHLRDIAGNPFRPVALDPSWRTEAVVALARGMYEARDFAAMQVLADALEDAGCAADAVLAHCRTPGVHVRGCWVVDGVLGKN